MNKEIKLRDHKTKGHQRDASPHPGQEGSFIGEQRTRVGADFGLQPDSPPSSQAIVCPERPAENSVVSVQTVRAGSVLLAHGALSQQMEWLEDSGFAHRFQLIYMDPPFYSNKHYGAFSDEWESLNAYLDEMKGWLESAAKWVAQDGFLVLHCDYHASHYLKVIGDQIFGYANFRNEWVWHYTGRRTPASLRVNSKHDVLLVWAGSGDARFNPVFDEWNRDDYVAMKKQQVHRDEDGREWIWGHQGRGKSHAYRIYLDEQVSRGRAIDTVWDIPIINTSAKERTGYPTQKPLALLQRIITLTSNPGDWVADFACGSGTTGVAALEMGRKAWLGDANVEALEVTRRRLTQ